MSIEKTYDEKTYEEKIDKLPFITEEDKITLKYILYTGNPILLNKLTFYSNKYIEKKINDYEYIETTEPVFYITYNLGGGACENIVLDADKKIFFDSRWWSNLNCGKIKFLDHIIFYYNHIYILLDKNIENSYNVDKIGITIQSWFSTYGHFLDEIYNLYDFYNLKTQINQNINHNEELIVIKNLKNIYIENNNNDNNENNNDNYKKIGKILFSNDNIYNSNEYKHNIVKFPKCYIIKHNYIDKTFHWFPKNVTQHIFKKKLITTNKYFDKIFITRNNSINLNRNLDNQDKIETTLNSRNISLINPEIIDFDNLINIIHNANIIIITWGSALTNLVFAKNSSTVIILQSRSYEHEKINLFDKIIQQNNLNIVIIKHENNEINIDKLNNILTNYNI
jgi:hypothetical protein